MPVSSSDMKFRYSGGAANASPAASLGGARSSVDFVAGLNTLYDDVTPAEATSGDSEYRCFYVLNSNPTDTVNNVKFYTAGDTADSDTSIQIGLDPAGVGGEATTIANEQTAPAGVTFSAATSEAAALDIGTLGPGQAQAIWVKRTVAPGAVSYVGDSIAFELRGTPA